VLLQKKMVCKISPNGKFFSTGDWELGGSKRTLVDWHKLVWGPLLHPLLG